MLMTSSAGTPPLLGVVVAERLSVVTFVLTLRRPLIRALSAAAPQHATEANVGSKTKVYSALL